MLIDAPKALLFDMDGTLTEPLLDFPRIRAEMGIATRHIMAALAEMPPERREAAEAILHRHEDAAAEASTLNPGCRELLGELAERRMPMGLITLNRRSSVETVLRRHGLHFDVVITRESGPCKPDPHGIFIACEKLGVEPADAWLIGDGQYDVVAGRAAGMRTVWLSHGRDRDFPAEPWMAVRDLSELAALLRRCV